MFDTVIKGGLPYLADIAIQDGRVVEVGTVATGAMPGRLVRAH